MKKFTKRGLLAKTVLLLLVLVSIALLSACAVASTPPPPCVQTTKLIVDTAHLQGTEFCVPSNTNLTLSSTDGLAHTCTILGVNQKVSIPAGQSSDSFQIASGEYKLNCGRPSNDAVITSK